MRRSRHLRQAEETVIITHGDGTENEDQETASMIILEDKTPRFNREGVIIQDTRYVANLSKPLLSIEEGDRIRRIPREAPSYRGATSKSQILVVEDVRVLWGTQQLQLTDFSEVE